MRYTLDASLLSNEGAAANHFTELNQLFSKAIRLDCLVAFANSAGLSLLRDELEAALQAGLVARFVIGLDFCQTEPQVLYDLMELSEDYPKKLTLYIGNESRTHTFHPKAYVFQYENNSCQAIVGSANLTRGGMSHNHEFSVHCGSSDIGIAKQVSNFIARLLKSQEILLATWTLLDAYDEQHSIYALYRKLAEKRVAAVRARPPVKGIDLEILSTVLEMMRLETNGDDFDTQTQIRRQRHVVAKGYLDQIRTQSLPTARAFLSYYEPLVGGEGWHSGNLQRRKAMVAKNRAKFQQGLQALHTVLRGTKKKSVADIYDVINDFFQDVSYAGVNVITEILHSYDNERFAVMNKNSVSGLAKANIRGFPLQPSKLHFDGKRYAEFCKQAGRVRNGLGLRDFTELDALLNYSYWR